MAKKDLAKWFFEGALIVFSVLIALVIDQAVEQRKTENEKDAALERIALELRGNSEIVERWRERHGDIGRRLAAVAGDPDSEVRDELLTSGYFDLGAVFGGESFIAAMPSKSAWEAARSKGIVSEFEYETVQALTDAYSLQRIVSEQTVGRLTALYFDRETHNPESMEGTLIQFQLLVAELVAQEATLAYHYSEALGHLDSMER